MRTMKIFGKEGKLFAYEIGPEDALIVSNYEEVATRYENINPENIVPNSIYHWEHGFELVQRPFDGTFTFAQEYAYKLLLP